MKTCLVIPSCREESIKSFFDKNSFDCDVIVVEDNDKKTLSLPGNVQHYSHKEIADDLGDKAWIIPHRNASVRSYGYYKAWQQGADYIITLDDDCAPRELFIEDHIEALTEPAVSNAWTNTIQGIKTRGIPFIVTDREVETIVNHGVWDGNYDLDGITQLVSTPLDITLLEGVMPKGNFFPLCGMNLAFKAKAVPMMYFLLMGRDYIYDRYDDIWAGLFIKKICDHLNYGIKSGRPFVHHTRASDMWTNIIKESTGYKINETLWQKVDNIILTKKSISECYIEIAEGISDINGYFTKLSEAMKIWVSLYA
jgi:reversibly glycosylated polypeptide/UDP-arabinopyranose mutase